MVPPGNFSWLLKITMLFVGKSSNSMAIFAMLIYRRGSPRAIFGQMMIYHWNFKSTIFRQSHIRNAVFFQVPLTTELK